MTEARTKAASIHTSAPGWTGHVRHSLGVIALSDSTIYDPPMRVLEITGTGNLTVVLDGDDETDTNAQITLAVTAGTPLTYYAIRQARVTGSTATVGKGFT